MVIRKSISAPTSEGSVMAESAQLSQLHMPSLFQCEACIMSENGLVSKAFWKVAAENHPGAHHTNRL